ncbi:unnamed protein product [Nesidiocoris tenuis]|uniref:Uncharacterized protein n=1 Tax=Nesidiocoris tenuis TaxID=355587 RepID=A0A6H5G2J0_9HEMI|nr:unnamed protein product [Nesidiocoris tenuis]
MKNKPLRHKEQNTFKFEPFSQRIANIKIDVFHKVAHKYDTEDEETTHFHQALEKWSLLNLSDSFEQMRSELVRDVKILPQLLAVKDDVVSLIWEPVSSHIIDYSRCLMVSEFWPIFHDFFINVVECIQKETKIGTSLSNFQVIGDAREYGILNFSERKKTRSICSDEYFKRNADAAVSWDITNRTDDENTSTVNRSRLLSDDSVSGESYSRNETADGNSEIGELELEEANRERKPDELEVEPDFDKKYRWITKSSRDLGSNFAERGLEKSLVTSATSVGRLPPQYGPGLLRRSSRSRSVGISATSFTGCHGAHNGHFSKSKFRVSYVFKDVESCGDMLNYGSKILLPFVHVILERLKRKLESKRNLDRKEREVMSRVTEMVNDPQSSEVLLELLFPTLMKKAEGPDDVIGPLLTTVYNLIKNVEKPGRYVRKLAPLYSSVCSPSSRKLLFSIVIALSKQEGFSTVVKAVDQPFATRTLTQFILPIVSHYLASEKYHNKNTIVDSAIAALGAVCLYLPWYQYQTVLLYYLGRLQAGVEYQRQIVRILVEILNAFHFDLSKGDLTVLNELRGVLPDDENGEIDDEKRQEEVKKEENPAVTDESTAEDIGTCNTELSRTMSHKYVSKVRLALEQVVLGLTENAFLPPESLLTFAYGTSSESVPSLVVDVKDNKELDAKTVEFESRRPTDCYLLPQVSSCTKPLQLANSTWELKAGAIFSNVATIIIFCFQVGTVAAKCLMWVLKMELPSLRRHIKDIAGILFTILHKFACAGLSKGDNFDLVLVTFNSIDTRYYRQKIIDIVILSDQKYRYCRYYRYFYTWGKKFVSEPSCRKTAADIIADLLSRLDGNGRSKLFDIATVWLNTKHKLAHRKLAAQVIGIFVTVEKEDFERRLKDFLPSLVEAFVGGGESKKEIGRFVKAPQVVDEQENTSKDELDKDHFMFQLLQTIVKMATHVPKFLKKEEFAANVETLADHAISLLGHPHQWVRHSAVQLIGLVLTSSYQPSELANVANDSSLERSPGFLLIDTRSRLKSLAHDVIAQLIPSEDINEKFLMQCMKLLTYLAEIIKDIRPTDECKLSVLWLVRMVQKMVNYEVVNSPSSTVVRSMAFNFAAAVSLKLSQEELSPLALQLLKPIARQLNVDDEDPNLKRSAREAANYIRKKIGADLYNETMAKLSNLMDVKRAERKKQRTQLVKLEFRDSGNELMFCPQITKQVCIQIITSFSDGHESGKSCEEKDRQEPEKARIAKEENQRIQNANVQEEKKKQRFIIRRLRIVLIGFTPSFFISASAFGRTALIKSYLFRQTGEGERIPPIFRPEAWVPLQLCPLYSSDKRERASEEGRTTESARAQNNYVLRKILKDGSSSIRLRKYISACVLNVLWAMVTGSRFEDRETLEQLISYMEKRAKAFDMSGGVLSQFPWVRHFAPERTGYNLIVQLNQNFKKMIMLAHSVDGEFKLLIVEFEIIPRELRFNK